jgi:hypothetical protein
LFNSIQIFFHFGIRFRQFSSKKFFGVGIHFGVGVRFGVGVASAWRWRWRWIFRSFGYFDLSEGRFIVGRYIGGRYIVDLW